MRLFLIVVALGMGIVGVQECRLAGQVGDEAQTLTCAQLGANGPGENVHVVMSDFFLLEHAYIYMERYGNWDEVFIPAVPLGADYHKELVAIYERDGPSATFPPPKDVRVMVKLPDAENEDDVSASAQKDSLQGLVINEIDEIGDDERELLAKSYPGIDFEQCWILEVGREPKGIWTVILMVGGGALLLLAVVGSWLAGAAKNEEQDEGAEPETEGE